MEKRRRESGFTLVDLAAAVAFSSVALVATAASVISGAGMARSTAETRAAVRMSSALMERIRATPFDQLVATWNDTTHPIAEVGGGDSSGTAAVRVVPLETGSTKWSVYEVTVTSTFRGAAGENSSTLVTYVCDRFSASSMSGSVTRIGNQGQ